jgi:putative transposase
MKYQDDFTLSPELLERITSEGFDILAKLIQIVINAAIQEEHQHHLRAAPYLHSPDRKVYANGFKPKTVKTRLGDRPKDGSNLRHSQSSRRRFLPASLGEGTAQRMCLDLDAVRQKCLFII